MSTLSTPPEGRWKMYEREEIKDLETVKQYIHADWIVELYTHQWVIRKPYFRVRGKRKQDQKSFQGKIKIDNKIGVQAFEYSEKFRLEPETLNRRRKRNFDMEI